MDENNKYNYNDNEQSNAIEQNNAAEQNNATEQSNAIEQNNATEQNNANNNLDDFFTNGNKSEDNNKNNNNSYYDNDYNKDPYSYTAKKEGVPKWVIAIVSVILSITFLVAGGFGGYFIGTANKYNSDDMQLTNTLYDMIQQYYYQDISREDFDKAAALGVSSMLDDFSGLMLTDSEPSPLFGVTIVSDTRNHHYIRDFEQNSSAGLTVGTEVSADGKAISSASTNYKIMRGDELYMLNGVNVVGLSRERLNDSSLLGKEASVFVMKRIIEGETTYISFSLEKSFYEDTDAMYTSKGNVGIIDLDTFGGEDISDFEQSVNEFRADGATKLILDLRDNGGGRVEFQTQIATYLIDHSRYDNKDVPINRIVDKNGNVKIYTTDLNKEREFIGTGKVGYELVILVNGNSASASEGLVGAVRAYMPETIVIGEPTYGKGVAQNTIPVPGFNLNLHITIGYYDVPVFVDGTLVWTNYHGTPHKPNEGYLIPSIDVLNPNGTMSNYYNNDITKELAYIAAMRAFDL